ncbi:hypothetical protein [Pedobacter sp. BS3]|uniref:hypothetical protein n=1 Tax=Pedobacter sp. BS3 TaxID=2567937 RepID=UPI0016596C09|nr:hypothetical protein [Pedobacter sp. BS3]
MPYVEISEKSSDKPNAQSLKKPNKQTIKAIKEVESGKTTKTTLEDFRKQLYS